MTAFAPAEQGTSQSTENRDSRASRSVIGIQLSVSQCATKGDKARAHEPPSENISSTLARQFWMKTRRSSSSSAAWIMRKRPSGWMV